MYNEVGGDNLNKDYSINAKIFKALSDENRWEIINLLITGEKCACELLEQLNIGQSTLSHHMRILCESKIIKGRKEGKWIHYSINKVGVEQAKELLNEINKGF